MVDQFDPRAPTRQELARVFKDQRMVRAFEKLFDLVPNDLLALQLAIDGVLVSTIEALSKANAALYDGRIISLQGANYSATTSEKIICTNALTVTLNPTPIDLELVTVTATNGYVEIDGNGKTISNLERVTITQNYTSLDILYSIELDAWVIT